MIIDIKHYMVSRTY